MPSLVTPIPAGWQGPRGPVGATGATGPVGPEGKPGRYGQIRFADLHVDPEDVFPAGVRQQLQFAADPAQTQDFLRAPFSGQVAWTNSRIVPRPDGYGDWLDIIVNLLVVAGISPGTIVADLDVGTGTPTGTADYTLRQSAGTPERVTFRLGIQTLNGFLANGCRVFLTGTMPFTVQSEAVIVLPISAGPGQP